MPGPTRRITVRLLGLYQAGNYYLRLGVENVLPKNHWRADRNCLGQGSGISDYSEYAAGASYQFQTLQSAATRLRLHLPSQRGIMGRTATIESPVDAMVIRITNFSHYAQSCLFPRLAEIIGWICLYMVLAAPARRWRRGHGRS